MPSAKQILKQLQAEVDEARDALVNEVLASAEAFNLPAGLPAALRDYREKKARLDKAQGA
jgi:predicted  nucleic acid-binding Zn-ribbon protein